MLSFLDSNQLITMFGILLGSLLTFLAYSYTKNKDKREAKIKAYDKLIAECINLKKQLDIDTTPFKQIYKYKNEGKTQEQWEQYFIQHITPYHPLCFALEDEIEKLHLYLPDNIYFVAIKLKNQCLSYVSVSSHYNTAYIIDQQNLVNDTFKDLQLLIKNDLK